MYWTLTAVGIVCLGAVMFSSAKRRKNRQELELHSITPDALYAILSTNQGVLVYDVRQPLDLLADS